MNDIRKSKGELLHELDLLKKENQTLKADFQEYKSQLLHAGDSKSESEINLKAIFENSKDSIGVSKNGEYIFANHSYLKLFGYKRNENLTGCSILNNIAPSHHKDIIENIKQRFSGEDIPTSYETRGRKKDGSEFDIEVNVTTYEFQKEIYTLVNMRDITEQNRIKEFQRKSEMQFRSFFESVSLLGVIIDDEGKINLCNDYLLNLTGWKREEVLGKNWFEMFLPPTIHTAMEFEIFQKYLRHGQIQDYNMNEIITRDGELRLIEWSNTVIRDQNDNVISVAAIGEDVTKRKHAEKALKESEAQFRALFENASDGIIYLSLTGEIVKINKSFAKLHGYTFDEIQKIKLKDLDIDDMSIIFPARMQRIAYGENLQFDVRHRHKDGSIIHLEVSTCLIKYQKETYIVAFHRNISKRKQVEESLKQSVEKFRSYVDFAPHGILVADEKGNYVDANLAASVITGFSKSELTKMNISDLIPENAIENVAKHFETVVKHGISTGEFPFKRKDNSIRFWTVDAVKLSDTRFLGFVVDTTERKNSEAIIKLNMERTQSLLNISQYKTNDIHEFLDFSLNEAVKMTSSKLGYIYFYDEEKKVFILNSWSKEVMDECSIVEKQRVYELEKTGIWGEAVRQRKPVIVNNYHDENPLKKGYPSGHAELFNFMTIPMIYNGKIVAVAGLGNKDQNYNESDVMQLSLLMEFVWRIVERIQSDLANNQIKNLLEDVEKG